MRRLGFLSAAMLLIFTAAAEARPVPEAKLMLVYAYADWCPNCKLLTPKLAQARRDGKLDTQPVLFVTLDLTDKPRIKQSLLLAQALGIGDFLRAQGSATGYAALLDAQSKKELARFDRSSDATAIRQAIEQALR